MNREKAASARAKSLAANPILVTALNATIGYEKGAQIAKKAYAEKRPILEVAIEETDLTEQQLKELLDPMKLTKGGLNPKWNHLKSLYIE